MNKNNMSNDPLIIALKEEIKRRKENNTFNSEKIHIPKVKDATFKSILY